MRRVKIIAALLLTILVIVVFYLLLGMFLDILSCIILTIPLIYPLVIDLGFDPIWFGVMVVLIMEFVFMVHHPDIRYRL